MNNNIDAIIAKFESKNSIVAVIGLGYVGLPLMLHFAEMGYRAIGIDVDEEKIAKLHKGQSYIAHISQKRIQSARDFFQATTDFSSIKEADAILLCIPTPLNKYREPDLSFVINTVKLMLPHLRPGQLISLESTTYPGTTEEELKPLIEELGFVIGKDIFLVYSPEREDPGNTEYTTKTMSKICGGMTDNCLNVGMALYSQVIDKVIPVSSTKTAEMTKLLENIHRAVNIGLVNEMKIVADKMGIDIYEVINAAATKPFGFVPYYPGPGLGGHCIPIDPFYLTWKAREYGLHTRFIELAGEINSSMPKWVIAKLIDGLNEHSKSLKNSKILLVGIAYKKNVDDMRESPAVAIMEILVAKGASVAYYDPYVPSFPKMREHHFDLSSIKLSAEELQNYDAIVITTNHDHVDYQLIQENAKLIVDTRGVYRESLEHVVKA